MAAEIAFLCLNFSAIPSILTAVEAGLKEVETSWIPPENLK